MYNTRNWAYVVLSRVQELKRLFILKKLDPEKNYSVDPNLIREEERLSKIEEEVLANHKPICTYKKND